MPLYRYTPLKNPQAIRILTLYPGTDDIPKGTLTIREKDEEYEALSWHWGGEDNSDVIQIKDNGEWCNLFIKPNLKAALKQLRHNETTTVRKLWIDAICMDQESSFEKNAQVPMMAEIYSNATEVCVWLGKEAENSAMAVKFIRDRVLDLGAFDELVDDQKLSEEWGALTALMSREWFSRRWVVQELALAKRATLHCGKDEITWDKFAVAIALFERRSHRLSELVRGDRRRGNIPDYFGDVQAMGASRLVHTTSSMYRRADDGTILERLLSLEALVSILSDFNCRIPHDVFYAVLALGKDTHHHSRVKPWAGKTDATNGTGTQEMSTEQGGTSANGTRNPAGSGGHDPSEPATSDQHDHNASASNDHNDSSQNQQYTEEETEKLKFVIDRFRQARNAARNKIFMVSYDMPFFEVCKHFLEFAISSSKSLDLLCRPWAHVGENLPSWIPDLSGAAFGSKKDKMAAAGRKMTRRNADPLVGQASLQRRNYSAAKNTTADWKQSWNFGDGVNGDERSMFVKGFVLDTIVVVQDSALMGNIPAGWLEVGWPNISMDAPERFWRTLVADRAPNGLNVPVYYPLAWQYAVSQSDRFAGIDTQNLIQNGGCKIMAEFLRRVQTVIWDRRLIKTRSKGSGQQDLIGLGPKRVERGDSESS